MQDKIRDVKKAELFEKVLPLLIAIAGVLIPVWVTLDIYQRGPSPEKHIELSRLGPIDPMNDLSSLYESATLQLRFGDQAINNVVVVQGIFRNTGGAPIVPSDYVENLSVSVPAPWKIVSVKDKGFSKVRLDWTRVSDTRFEAKPALLNPGDMAWAVVYLTNTKYQQPAPTTDQARPDPQVDWNARIVNLRSFTDAPDYFDRQAGHYGFIFVQLGGYWLWLTVGMALVSQAVFLRLLARAGYLRRWNWKSIALVAGLTFLSFSAAEAAETYLCGNTFTDLEGVSHWLNAPPLIAQTVVILVLYFQPAAKKATSRTKALSAPQPPAEAKPT